MKEALKLALEAAEDFADVIKYDNEQDDIGSKACCGVLSYHPHSESCKAKQAITAIKEALAQPAQEPDHGNDDLTIAYMSGVHRGKELAAQPAQEPWCMKMNGCKTKCADCPDEPAQEPVAWHDKIMGMEVSMDVSTGEDDIDRRVYGQVYEVILSDGGGTPDVILAIKSEQNYTTPQQRPWVGLTKAQFLEATRLAENGNYLVAFVRIQEWLKEKNNG